MESLTRTPPSNVQCNCLNRSARTRRWIRSSGDRDAPQSRRARDHEHVESTCVFQLKRHGTCRIQKVTCVCEIYSYKLRCAETPHEAGWYVVTSLESLSPFVRRGVGRDIVCVQHSIRIALAHNAYKGIGCMRSTDGGFPSARFTERGFALAITRCAILETQVNESFWRV